MKILRSSNFCFTILLIFVACLIVQVHCNDITTTYNKKSPCFLRKIICPNQCPSLHPSDPKAKACYFDDTSPICKAQCKNKKPNCEGKGSACKDPRFIGGDGIVFYFHGKKNEHFTLVSDQNLQINARFIGLRPAGRSRDFTWIQALGILFGDQTFSIEATKAPTWNQNIDHLKFSYNGQELDIPAQYPSVWTSSEKNINIERTSSENSVLITLTGIAEISINVVPVTKEDDRIHSYRIPFDDCFAHLEIQFKFYGFSEKVEGILGRTYQPDFVNPAKPGVAMPVVGGEDKYRTSSLLGTDCAVCMFSPDMAMDEDNLLVEPVQGTLDCAGGSMNGIVCRK